MTAGTALLNIHGVSRSFGDTRALDDVSLEIHENEFFALLGPSGCGKTTLLRVIAGFEQPDEGTVTLDGVDLLPIPPEKRAVNLMFQSYALFPHMTVERNVAYGLVCERLPRDEIRARVDEVLRTVGLTDKRSSLPRELSGGQRQRVALARAIVKRPRLLLLDEPLSALDRKIRGEMQIELKRLQHEVGITFVVVTHDQDEAMSLADRVAVMDEGVVRQLDAPLDLYRRPRSIFVADFIGSSTVLKGTYADGAWQAVGVGAIAAGADCAGAIAIALRPEAVRLTMTDDAAAVRRGTVQEVYFQGDHALALVKVDEVAFLANVRDDVLPSRGSDVGVAWDASSVIPLFEE
ncbi:MAG: ABC transporter ATP-binding protein [Actinomycetota bacterium]